MQRESASSGSLRARRSHGQDGSALHGRADHRDPQGSGGGDVGRRGDPTPRDHAPHLLPLEGEVRRDGGQRCPATQGARGREPALEAGGGQPDARHPDLEGAAGKRLTTVAGRRAAVADVRARHAGVSERHACALVGCALSSQRYRSHRAPQAELRARLHELAVERVRWGYRRLHLLLRREGRAVNVKRVYPLYREEGLAVRPPKRKCVAGARAPQAVPTRLNEWWGMDFMSDALVGGRRYRILNVLERMSRESLAGEVDTSLPARRVTRVLDEIALERGYPFGIVVDNGSEFRSAELDAWAYEHGVVLQFIQPGKPIQNAAIESFNGRMRDELLNQHWWRTIDDARRAIASYREDYNHVRPHSALGNQTPAEFASALRSL